MQHKRELFWTNAVIAAEKRGRRTASCPRLDLEPDPGDQMTSKVLIYSRTINDEREKYLTEQKSI